MPGFTVLNIDEVPPRPGADERSQWIPLRHALGVGAFGINAYRASERGVEVIQSHDEASADESGQQELYLVLSGSARFDVGGTEIAARPGTIVFVEDPSLRRVAIADEPGTTVLAIGGQPDAFQPSEWEARWLDQKSPIA